MDKTEDEFQCNGKFFPYRYLTVKVDNEAQQWVISTESLQTELENTTIKWYVHNTLEEIIFFYVPDDVLRSEGLVEFVKENVNVEFELIEVGVG
jgi:hypothetical protein